MATNHPTSTHRRVSCSIDSKSQRPIREALRFGSLCIAVYMWNSIPERFGLVWCGNLELASPFLST